VSFCTYTSCTSSASDACFAHRTPCVWIGARLHTSLLQTCCSPPPLHTICPPLWTNLSARHQGSKVLRGSNAC
jgi:hypothetical protein